MGIPQLTTCCCGCSLRTGTKIIGWVSLVGAVLMLIMSCLALSRFYYLEDHPDTKPEDETKYILSHLPALKALTVFLIITHILASCLAFTLLLGTYQNKAKLIFFWVVVALTIGLVEQALNLVEALVAGQPGKLLYVLTYVVDLYFILVVYSFYREIRNMSEYA